ncbi:hypothetical protein SERLA73DRAFT_159877 [Serpula lacrymans var. lacrymans S7.3]|uniref:Cytochrome P450 n=2 Tax=Serpula lacrymans var. lacrymans TaxID=341189 RepID=F8PUE1_SERL3|nr:uncharacterized protein SERLADRAFT_414901 [Serpula lacrymans var. lacrymans S7.9]EGN99661.1 hypothetical protein SERLA73DRAFT_159877 [Serpula lacrymans var. lacrymans S7.3]EGO25224.1 hypothetical protein SERLADRAFT_414901 [Serpula lacrymans var. lacrymans S7.9]
MLQYVSLLSCALFTLFLSFAISRYLRRPNLDSIPTVGPGGLLTSYWGALVFLFHARETLQKGYTNYKGMAFKVPGLFYWNVILSGPKLVEEIRKAPEDYLSAREGFSDILKPKYTLGHETIHNPYHVSVILTQLTRNLAARFPDIIDEIKTSFDDNIQLVDYEWKSVPAYETIVRVVCRTSNRVFVGLPLCRDPDWNDLVSGFALDVVKVAVTIGLFPDFVAPFVGRLLSNLPRSVRRGMKHLQPIIEERQKNLDEYGSDWDEKPNDMLSWLMDEAEGEECSVQNLTRRMLTINFSAIHTSSINFTHALFYLAANPQYVEPLREEVEATIEEEGWSKNAIAKMRKVDSFLKETLRFEGLSFVSMLRKAVKDFTFSDGTLVPAGSMVSVASFPTHRDNETYENADVFDPFRFANEKQVKEQACQQMVSTNPEFLTFGHGKNACPGRFFAATELKAMLAHIVVTYDVKFENKGLRPANITFGAANSPNTKAKIMFRKRVV